MLLRSLAALGIIVLLTIEAAGIAVIKDKSDSLSQCLYRVLILIIVQATIVVTWHWIFTGSFKWN